MAREMSPLKYFNLGKSIDYILAALKAFLKIIINMMKKLRIGNMEIFLIHL